MREGQSLSFTDRDLQNHGVMSFDDSIGYKLLKSRQESIDFAFGVDEFDTKRHVAPNIKSAFLCVDAMMGAEARLWAQHACSGDASLKQQCKNLAAEKVALGAGVLVEVNRDFLGWPRREQVFHSFRRAYNLRIQATSIEAPLKSS
jgi:hypothetical protein